MILWVKHWLESVFLSLDPHIKSAPLKSLSHSLYKAFLESKNERWGMNVQGTRGSPPTEQPAVVMSSHRAAEGREDAGIWQPSAGMEWMLTQNPEMLQLERGLRDHWIQLSLWGSRGPKGRWHARYWFRGVHKHTHTVTHPHAHTLLALSPQ